MKKKIIFTIGILFILVGLIVTNPFTDWNVDILGWVLKVIGIVLILVSLIFRK